jgi:NADH-quinone oxidoreductase chain G
MIKVFINNKIIFVPKNTSVLEACESIGVYVSRFCYHERLNVAGNCRMCLVEIEKAPKPIASCAFPVASNMRVYTDTPMVQKARENVMEFLLLNHPLDCPICDQGGECDLQEQAMLFGSDRGRFFFNKRTVEDKNCGPLVKTIMTRCIHCTRCVRFFQDVAGQEDFGTTLRGRETEIGTYVGKILNSELSGNVIDLCPVGALTSKPYAFAARPWEIKTIETIDVNDSIGSNIKINFKETEILRVLPALNDSLNEEWISDKTRFCFDALKLHRLGSPFLKIQNKFTRITWKEALIKNATILKTLLKLNSEQVVFVSGNNADLETLQVIKKTAQDFGIRLITEDFLRLDSSFMSAAKFNTTFTDILESDLCLSIGTNTRFEASLLNVRLKKRIKMGKFIKASIGLCDELTYSNDSIGNSFKTLIDIAEGKHPFCQKLIKAKNPFIIIGSTLKKRIDAASLDALIFKLTKYTKIIDENWLGINFLSLTANKVGESLIGLDKKNKQNFAKVKYIYCIGLDSYSNLFSKINVDNVFIVSQSPFSDPLLQKTNLILPSTAFTEKENTFINLEGRFQKTNVVLSGPELAKNDSKIVSLISNEYLYKIRLFSNDSNLIFQPVGLNIVQNKDFFFKTLLFKKVKSTVKIQKTPFKLVISNFFSSNLLIKNSQILLKCASLFKKNYLNCFETIN